MSRGLGDVYKRQEKIIKTFCHTRPKMDERYVRRVKRLDELASVAKKASGFSLASTSDGEEAGEEE